MMKKVAISIALATTLTIPVYAVAEPVPGPVTGNVGYTAAVDRDSVIISTDAGSIGDNAGVLEIRSADGKVLAGTALSFRVDDFEFPIAAEIHERTATLTPRFDLAHATYKPVSLPFEDQAPFKTQYDREQAAWNRLSSTILMGATVGSLVGGVGGGAVGCLLGGIAGATVAAATIVGLFGPFIPAAALGCIGGIMAVGALGTLAGQLLVTAPVAIMAAVQYFTTINQPPPAK
ncbi:hypothetical protein [Nocardia sp. NRRL WC-3656]|uniref:hypothetical protein n=1 Tax=Nocardia sp. NRRL WC-3656 TaxID=1463824 RepID=UPI000AA4C781|nr:hypothetical protein [Nocardia sp. NRRL WC-3656]